MQNIVEHSLTENLPLKNEISFSNIHALVAEDNIINQKLIQVTLEKFGLKVTLTSNGKEALRMRKENEYDIIFMDIQMPVMNGIESTEAILHYEKIEHVKHIPIIALTANALAGDREKYIEAGMDNYLTKPLQIDRLSELIGEYFPHNINVDKKSISKQNDHSKVSLVSNEIDKVAKSKKAFDILLYMDEPLIVKIYKTVLLNLGYSIDIAKNANDFLDKLDEIKYNYILYEEDLFEQKNLIRDLVIDAKAKPIVIIDKGNKENYSYDTLTYCANLDEIKAKLN